jgi:hypothetical protein
MKISIKSLIGHGRIYDFDIESSITIQELKQRLREKTGDHNVQTVCLIFDGEQLDDDDTVSDFDIKAGSVLELINLSTKTRNLQGFFGLKFVDVSVGQGLQRIQWVQTAPRWRRARHGLCLEGQCTNSKCEAHGCTVIIPIGYRKFDMSIDPNETTTKCPACKKYVNPVTCGFNNCWWRYEGTKDCGNGPPQPCSSDWTQVDDAYHRFDEQESGIIVWRKLIFEAVKRRPSETLGGAPDDSVGLEISEVSEEPARSEASQSSATLTSSRSSAGEFQCFSLSYIAISKFIKMNINLFSSKNESVGLVQRPSLTFIMFLTPANRIIQQEPSTKRARTQSKCENIILIPYPPPCSIQRNLAES